MIKDSFSHIPSANPAFILTLIKVNSISKSSNLIFLQNYENFNKCEVSNEYNALFYSALYTGWWTKNFINDAYIFYDSINKI